MCVCVSENTGSKMKAALIHILLHMHRHSSFTSRVHTVSFSNTDTHTHGRVDCADSLAMPGKVCLQSSIVLDGEESMWENLLDKKGVGNGGMKEEKGGKSAFVGSGLAVSTSQLLGKGVRCSVHLFL